MGTLVTDTGTWQHGIDFPVVPPGDGYLDLEIDCLNLLPGRYSLSLWLSGVGGVIHDVIEHCARVEVELANVYRSSRIIDGRFGVVYFPQRWDLQGMGTENDHVSAMAL